MFFEECVMRHSSLLARMQINQLTLSIYHSYVRLDWATSFLTNVSLVSGQGGLNDGQWHNVTMTFSHSG